MQVKVFNADLFEFSAPAIIAGCFEDSMDDVGISRLDKALNGTLSTIRSSREFTGKLSRVKIIETLGRLPSERLVLVGLGKRRDLNPEKMRRAAGSAATALKSTGVSSCATILQDCGNGSPAYLSAVVEGFLLGSYVFDNYRTKPCEQSPLKELHLLVDSKKKVKAAENVAAEGFLLCEAVNLARDLVSHPGNIATPSFLGEQAIAVSGRYGLGCHVMDSEEIEQTGMHALHSVGKGSVNPPRFIVMQYSGGAKGKKPLVIIGKGVTFDSGGISLKPRDGMERMKDDMAGAAAVIGTMQAVAALNLKVNLVGLIPAAENMPDGRSYKPGDVIRTMSGRTVEINNTDAEGRMVLCDALHYALRYKPAVIIDLATLTGACLVALGAEASGLMGTDESLKKSLKKAGEKTGERLWELPLWEEYGEAMKSDIADFKNSGGAHAGTITAAWFLKQFVGNCNWAHLDIAGTAWEDKGKGYRPKGATGIGVRLLVEYLRSL